MHENSPALLLALIAFVGFVCQWAAWRIKLPAILLLLISGIVLGPGLGVIQPGPLIGDLLFPMVSLSVAIILFEGSLTLKFSDIKDISVLVRKLVTVGAVITWLLTAALSRLLFQFDWPMALLLGSVLVVTGPTVIIPMLRTVRPVARIGNILRWEGIVIDPIGALLAVVVYEYIVASGGSFGSSEAIGHSAMTFARICVIGPLLGAVSGQCLGMLLRSHSIPEYLHNFATVAVVLSVFTLSNSLEAESGLLAVTVMGIWLANMPAVCVEEILSFKENLTVLLISGLFIILAARIDPQQLQALGWRGLAFFAVLQLIIRPVAVFACTWNSDLNWRERSVIAWIGPRGIVAAAVSGLFALQLEQQNHAEAEILVALTFFVIIGTVLVQSVTAGFIAQLLGVRDPEPRGVLIIGANNVARAVASALQSSGFRIVLADPNRDHIGEARLAGLNVFYGNAISEHADRRLDLVGIGRLLAMSPRREDNVLASMRFKSEFGRNNIFALKTSSEETHSGKATGIADAYKGTFIGEQVTYSKMASWLTQGGRIGTTLLSEEFGFDDLVEKGAGKIHPLFAIDKQGYLHIFEAETKLQVKAGWSVVSIYQESVAGDKPVNYRK